jgi:hypothetical protein
MVNAGFFMDYPALRDNNFNSWDTVETFDAYDDSGTPRILGADGQGPRLRAMAQTVGGIPAARTSGGTYLHLSSGITIDSIHVTEESDTDTVYTVASTATGAITGGTTTADSELGFVYGYAVTGGAAAVGQNVRMVVKTSTTDMDVADAIAYIYDPEEQGTAANGAGLSETNGGTILTPTAANPNAVAGSTWSINNNNAQGGVAGEVALDGNNLIVELPATTPTQGQVIVIQNVGVNGHLHSIHIPIPAARTQVAGAPSTTEAGITDLGPLVYKHVYLHDVGAGSDESTLGTTGTAGAIQSGQSYTATSAAPTIDFNFREPLASTVTATWSRGDDDDGTTTAALADVNTVDFTVTAAVSTAANGADANVPADAEGVSLSFAHNVSEANTDHRVGHDAQLTVNVSDHSNNPSSFTITLKKGHGELIEDLNGGATDDDEVAILNVISGSAID